MPSLHPGNEILIQPVKANLLDLKVSDIVVVQHPHRQNEQLIKRIVHIDLNNQLDLRGDNTQESTDSRHFGKVPVELVQGKVTCIFSAQHVQ